MRWLFAQQLAARASERAAIEFYRRQHAKVEDISSTQIDGPEDGPWTTFDLSVDGTPVDVKSARRLARFRGARQRTRYSEPRVAAFKKHDGKEVRIAGILSPWVYAGSYSDVSVHGISTDFTYLGEITESRFDSLAEDFDTDSFVWIERGENGEHLLPAWIFDLPVSLYRERDEARVRCLASLPDVSAWNGVPSERRFPLSLALEVALPAAALGLDPARWEVAFRAYLLERRAPRSLPRLWLSLCTHFIECAQARDEAIAGYTPVRYRDLLFAEPGSTHTPLGIYDPLATIDNLIEVLGHLWTNRARVQHFTHFKLLGEGIFVGAEAQNAPWWTLVAYCGGCGSDPLVVGDDDFCAEHRRLVCTRCGYCRDDCRPGTERGVSDLRLGIE